MWTMHVFPIVTTPSCDLLTSPLRSFRQLKVLIGYTTCAEGLKLSNSIKMCLIWSGNIPWHITISIFLLVGTIKKNNHMIQTDLNPILKKCRWLFFVNYVAVSYCDYLILLFWSEEVDLFCFLLSVPHTFLP